MVRWRDAHPACRGVRRRLRVCDGHDRRDRSRSLHPMNYEHEDLEKLGGPCIKAVARLAHFWSLTDEEQAQILKTDVQTLESWRARVDAGESVELDIDTVTRVGAMLGIFRSLMTL